MLEALLTALDTVSQANILFYIVLGTLLGLFCGALPGIGGVVAMSLVLPLTYGWDVAEAMCLLTGIMGGIPFGGSISAILLNTPGVPVNAATCFDGYPMTQKGQGGKAIVISATSSATGAIFGLIVLVALIPLLRLIVLAFGPPEYFMLVLFGLVTVAFAARGSLIKGLFAGGIGIFISLIGFSNVSGIMRFTAGSDYLWDGVTLIPLLVGLFAVSEAIRLSLRGGTIAAKGTVVSWRGALSGFTEVFKHKVTLLRGSIVGTIIGIIPGVGGTVANFLAYTTAVQSSKHPETFGTGDPEGVIAAESANNAKDGGAIVPTVSFGIPGSAEMAVLLAAFTLHGLVVGPGLLRDRLDILFLIVLGLLISNILASSLGILVSGHLARLTTINVAYLAPVVLLLCVAGTYGVRENIWDVLVTFVAGLLGFGLVRFGFPIICLVIGYILGELAERAFHQSLMMSFGNYGIFFTSPIALVLFTMTVAILLYPLMRRFWTKRGAK